MAETISQDLESLHQTIVTCVGAWSMGYDEFGYEHFIQGLNIMECVIDEHFSSIKGDFEPLYHMLVELNQFVQRSDIMAVQDVVEYKWQPLVVKWVKS